MILPHRALYASFDKIPSPKGAATHIERFAGTLCNVFEGGLLHFLGDADLSSHHREDNIEIIRYNQSHNHFLDRTLGFGHSLSHTITQIESTLELCHFRDPWSGLPILNRPHQYQTVYEINGLPSIELPYVYPLLTRETLDKIRWAERYCWEHCDIIITPSPTIAKNLMRMGAKEEKIQVIPNGADPSLITPPRPEEAPNRYLIYFGALQPWQGVDILLRAFQRLSDLSDLQLVICSSSQSRLARPYIRLAENLGIGNRILWKQGLARSVLAGWVAHAAVSVAPFTECSRNLEQGCAPLKLLEAMALGTPVIASDLPAVRDIVTDRIEARLVHADRPPELARAIRIALEYPETTATMGQNAKARLEKHFTWSSSVLMLRNLYISLTKSALQSKENS